METAEPGQLNIIQPLFLGFETLIRGYAYESFSNPECFRSLQNAGETISDVTGSAFSTCPALDRLFGDRVGVVSLEARVPFIGTEQFGIINFPFLPTELVAFVDGGIAFDSFSDIDKITSDQIFSSQDYGVIPVWSAGVSARVNILGFLILE
ncbi:MAG: hypothetical protein P8188_09060, partial [Gemmatimonadota bacterium]